MDRIKIIGGHRLEGQIPVSGAKNAALPLMAAALLTDQPLWLENLPRLGDIATMAGLLEQLGAKIELGEGIGPSRRTQLHVPKITDTTASYDLVRKMRAGSGVVLENSRVTWPSHSGSSGVTLTMMPQRA